MHEIDASKLMGVCADIGIPDDEASFLCGVAAQLLHFEKVQKKRLLTDSQRAKDLEKIAGLADELAKALHKLSDEDARSIAAWMPPDGLAVHWQIGIQGQGYTGVIGGPVENGKVSYPAGKGRAGHIANEARGLVIGARSFRVDLLPTESKGGGPRNMLHHYAHYVHQIAEALRPVGLSIGRGGSFKGCVMQFLKLPAYRQTLRAHCGTTWSRSKAATTGIRSRSEAGKNESLFNWIFPVRFVCSCFLCLEIE